VGFAGNSSNKGRRKNSLEASQELVGCVALNVRQFRCGVKRGSNHELYDLNPAADADPKLVPSSKPLRHLVTNYGEKRAIRETN
jgi:hypothetical protein